MLYIFVDFRIRSDHNIDNTVEILNKWINSVSEKYHSIDFESSDDNIDFSDSKGIAHWSEDRFSHIIGLRESALNYARNKWADYYLVISLFRFFSSWIELACFQ